ncbi:MAG: glycosyltransferase family 4 protein [Planctomycetes bacterium]|nr:glycosyltransferase family 4 protein [Planctomycetota bacterium]
MVSKDQAIRVAIQQPALAKYRVPVFRELAGRDGIELEVLYGERPSVPNVPAVGFSATPMRFRQIQIGPHPVYWQYAQLAAVHRRRADVAILNWDVHYATLLPALLAAKANAVPTILWGHGYSKHESDWRRAIRNTVARPGTALMFYDRTTADQFVAEGWNPNRIFVAPNAIDQNPIEQAKAAWRKNSSRLEEFKKQKGLGGKDILLYVSRFEEANRVDLLLRAVATLQVDFPNIEAVLIGKENSAAQQLKELSKELGIEKRIRFLGAIYDEEDLAPWFLASKLFVYPANIGLSLLHAFGYGLPVVTGDNIAQHNPEIDVLLPAHNGQLFRDGDPKDLAKTLASLLRDDSRRTQMGMNALDTVQTQFTLTSMVDGMEDAIRYCAGKPPRRGPE